MIENIKCKMRKYKKLYSALTWCYVALLYLYFRFFMLVFSLFPICKNKIIFISYAGKGYGDNGKYIAEELLKTKNYNLFWASFKKYKNTLPKEINYIRINSIKYLYDLATAKIWINNGRFPLGIRKRKNQYYIQTWHSTIRNKTIEKDAEELLPPQNIAASKSDSRMINMMISGSEFSSNIFKNSFWYNGEVLNCGMPRCDVFFNDKQKKLLKEQISREYGFSEDSKIILYAPTFRTKDSGNEVYLDCEKLKKILNDNYVILLRAHPMSNRKFVVSNNIFDVTRYPDMQELIAISDFLVTDYSSCSFDMMINSKPCILLTKDLESYLKNERKLYFNFDELPFPRTTNEEDLAYVINNFDFNKYIIGVNSFTQKIGLYEKGTAAKSICKIIEREIIK